MRNVLSEAVQFIHKCLFLLDTYEAVEQYGDTSNGLKPKLNDSYALMATGMAVYALRMAGQSATDPAIEKGVSFLLANQAENGSWPTTPGTKKKAQGKPVETSIYWGTCWSVIGLASVLSDQPL